MKLRFSPRAHADIADIYQYIAQYNTAAATAVVRQIRSTSQLLARHPGLGRETDIPDVHVFPTARYPYPRLPSGVRRLIDCHSYSRWAPRRT